MEIIISDEMKIKEVQEKFNEHFPFLKLEFYKNDHDEGEGSPKRDILNSDFTLKEAGKDGDQGEISIHGNQKVSTLEDAFQETFGLNVQVFRKSGELWLQTTTTDSWTLSEQNREGEEMAGR